MGRISIKARQESLFLVCNERASVWVRLDDHHKGPEKEDPEKKIDQKESDSDTNINRQAPEDERKRPETPQDEGKN